MMEEPTRVHRETENQSTTHFIYVLMQFAVAVRRRKNVLIMTLVVAVLLGALYYATAIRYYSAKASLLVLQSGSDTTSTTSMTPQGSRQQSLMPTYENLITSAKVLNGALKYLSRPEDRIDMTDVPRENWTKVLQKNLTAKTVHNTNIIEIEYRSKDPGAAVAVVNAVVQSYLDFMDMTHKGTAGEIIRVLTKEKVELADKLAQKEIELQEARSQVGALGLGVEEKVVHPIVQRAISFNEAVIEIRQQRVELEATLSAIHAAIRNGENLQQHILTVANVVGKEMLLSSLGFNTRDAATQAAMEKDLLADRAKLKTMEEHLGPRHPNVIALLDKIHMTEQYLLGYQDRINQRLAEIHNTRLGPMLVGMMQQKLNEVWQREMSLEEHYQQAQIEASGLNGQLAQIEIIEHDVKWLRDLHDVLLNRIANIDLKNEGPDIRTSIVSEPVKATAPISPNLRRVFLMALVAGLGLGLAGVYVLDILDDRFRSLEEMQTQLGAPVLAMVRQLKAKEFAGLESLQIYAEPDAAESEAFRTLRTGLSLADQESQQIVVSSPEPGDGKTTILANLAISYAQAEKRTLLIDADLRRPGLTAKLGLRGVDGLSGIIQGGGEVIETAASHIRASGIDGLDVLPSGPRPPNPAELLANPRFAEFLAWAETVYDQILIDSPPTLAASDTAVIGRLVDGVILVVQPDKNRRRLVLRAAESFAILRIPLLGIVINRVGAENSSGYCGYESGYGYEYGYHKDNEENQAEEHDSIATLPVETAPPKTAAGGEPGSGQADPAATIIPRRVA